MTSKEEEMIKFIDKATYYDLLRRWRFAPVGDPFFTGEVGKHYQKVIQKRREEVGDEEHVRISKSLG